MWKTGVYSHAGLFVPGMESRRKHSRRCPVSVQMSKEIIKAAPSAEQSSQLLCGSRGLGQQLQILGNSFFKGREQLGLPGAECAQLFCNFLGCAQHPCALLRSVVARSAALLGKMENGVLSY